MSGELDVEHDNFYRIVSLTTESSSKSLRSYIKHYVEKNRFPDIQAFLLQCFHVLFFLWSSALKCACGKDRKSYTKSDRKILTNTQWQELYHGSSKDCTSCLYKPNPGFDIDQADVTLCSCILKHSCTDLDAELQSAIDVIRNNRNDVSHMKTTKMDESEYNRRWCATEHAILTIAKSISDSLTNELTRDMRDIKVRFIDEAECKRFVSIMRSLTEV